MTVWRGTQHQFPYCSLTTEKEKHKKMSLKQPSAGQLLVFSLEQILAIPSPASSHFVLSVPPLLSSLRDACA